MCVNNYENIKDLRAVIISVFQEVSDVMVTSTMENFGRQLEMVLRNRANILKNKVAMNSVCVKYLSKS